MTTPKNILFIQADQLGACHLGCYGSGVPSTPTLDALAARGRRFDRCYASSPVCTPNRACLLTGRSPVVNGMVSNNYLLPPDTATYAQVLAHHGYRVGGFGKFHLAPMPLSHPEGLAYLGFGETAITEDTKWGAYMDWIQSEHPEHFEEALAVAWGQPRTPPERRDPRYAPERINEIRARILGPRKAASPWGMFYTSPLPAELHQTTWITDRALAFMEQRTAQAGDAPFFCFVSYVDPHDPYDPPAPYERMFSPNDMTAPIPAAWRREGNAVLEPGRTWQGFGGVSDNEEVVRQLRAHYHGSLRFIDDQVARLLAFLDQRNLWDDTVVVFTTDHGDMLGDHELTTKGVKPYDAGIRCPLIVAGADVTTGVSDRLTCTLDFFPSFCEWGCVPQEALPPLEGRSFAGACTPGGHENAWDSVIVAFGEMTSLLSADGWRLTLFDGDDAPDQLVHLREDPCEQENRYEDPSCAGRRAAMLRELAAHHMRLQTMPQYRNLPVVDGHKVTPGGPGNGQICNPVPLYCDPSDFPTW
jgi:arylsulfatase A-like enzyme